MMAWLQALRAHFLSGVLLYVMTGVMGVQAAQDAREVRDLQLSVGYRVIDLPSTGGMASLTVAAWYPTSSRPAPYGYGGPTRGDVAYDGLPLTQHGPYPMLVFSHGYGGGGLSAVFFAQALAARGWIVACPDHHDRHSAVRIRSAQVADFSRLGLLRHAAEIAATEPKDRAPYAYRFDELQRTIDGMLTSKVFGPLIDAQRLALGGHSFGGFTALGLSGTIAQRHEVRAKALLLFSTGTGGRLFSAQELATVKIPAMVFVGQREREQKRGDQTMAQIADKIYTHVAGPKYLLELKDASHFSFNNRFSDTPMARRMSGTPEQFEVISRYAVAFLEKYVAQRSGTEAVLAQRDTQLVRYWVQDAPIAD